MKTRFEAAAIAALALQAHSAAAHVTNHNLNHPPELVDSAFNGNLVADPCQGLPNFCQSINNFTRYGWEGGTTPFLEDSHYVTTNADEFDFHLDRAATVTIVMTAHAVEGKTLNPAFSVYKGKMPPLAHDDESTDPLNPAGAPPLYPPIASTRDAAPGDPGVSQMLINPDYSTSPNPDWTQDDAATYQRLYPAHNGYRDTLNHTPLGDFNFSYHGQFDAFGDWSMSNDSGTWAKLQYIASVSETPCAATGPCNGENSVGGYPNPGHTPGNAGLTETLTLKLAAGDYSIWAGGESALCEQARGEGTCYAVVNGKQTGTVDESIPGTHAYATIQVSAVDLATNNPPVANIGAAPSQVRAGASFGLDGSGSSDPDADDAVKSFRWTAPAGVKLSGAATAKPTVKVPLDQAGQTFSICLAVKDMNGAQSPQSCVSVPVTPENSAPTVKVIAQNVAEGAAVTLQATVTDPDGDGIAGYAWKQVSGAAVDLANAKADGPTLSFVAPVVGNGSGALSFSLTATDDYAAKPLSATGTGIVTVTNNASLLDCSAAKAYPASLWPARKAMQRISIGGVLGPKPARLTITGVTSDEPVRSKPGKDATGPDAKVKRGAGGESDLALLRAERQVKAGPANGRVYAVHFTASDGEQSCEGSVTVGVPAAQGQEATDDGQSFTATNKK